MQTVRRATLGERPSLLPLAEARTHAFATGLRRRPPGQFIWHYHPEIQLVWTWRGHGLRYVGNSVERFEPGDLVLIGANVPHMWVAADAEAVSAVTADGCFKEQDATRYVQMVAAGHEMMRAAARLADEARELEKGADSVLRTPHAASGEARRKTRLGDKPE